jgi:signal transduction histidine kinase
MSLNFFILSPLLATVLNITIAFWVFSYAAPGPVRRTFFMWNLWLGLWNGGVVAAYLMMDAESAFVLYRMISSVVVRFLAPLFLHFVLAFTDSLEERGNRKILYAAYGSSFVFAVVGYFTPLLMTHVVHYSWGYYPLAGKAEWTFGLIYTATVIYAFVLLWRSLQKAHGQRRHQIKSLLAGLAICFVGGMTNFLPLYGVETYPLGNLVNSLYSLVVAYTIMEHGLFDIRLLLRKGVVYGLLSGGLTLVYVSLVGVLQKIFGHYGVQENMAFYTAAFPITVVLAPAMKSRIEPFVDKTFSAPAPQESVSTLNRHDLSIMAIMAAEMAHELSKPLTHIMNEGGRLSATASGRSKEGLTRIGKEAQRAAEILDGFALLSPGRTLHKMPTRLQELLDEAVVSLGVDEDASIRIIRNYGELSAIPVNPGQIVQVLTNVIQNAWQAMANGGTLTFSLEETTASQITIKIEDTGSGIPLEIRDKLFEPFVTTKRSQGGRGVGLTITKAMVERHQGAIKIESPVTSSGGTRVSITLPIEKRDNRL